GCKAFIVRHRRGLAKQRAAARTAVEEEIERREARQEGALAALLVLRMLELLPHDTHARIAEGGVVEIAARAAHAAEERARADSLADVEEELRALAFDRELGAAQHRRGDPQRLAQELEGGEIQVHELVPAGLQDRAQPRRVEIEERGLAVGVAQREEMIRSPPASADRVGRIVHALLDDSFLL